MAGLLARWSLRCAAFPVAYFFFFSATASTEIYTLSLHDALPISHLELVFSAGESLAVRCPIHGGRQDRKSTRLNSSHVAISYAVFCLKKKIGATSKTWQPHRAPFLSRRGNPPIHNTGSQIGRAHR